MEMRIKRTNIPETIMQCPRGHIIKERTNYLEKRFFFSGHRGYGCKKCAIEDERPKSYKMYTLKEWKISEIEMFKKEYEKHEKDAPVLKFPIKVIDLPKTEEINLCSEMKNMCGLCGIWITVLEPIDVFDKRGEHIRLMVCLRCRDFIEGQKSLADKQVAKIMTEEEYQIGKRFR